MDGHGFRCVICGLFVDAAEDENVVTWLNEFRTIYSCMKKPGFTGVGVHLHANLALYTAPIDPEETWRNPELGDMIVTIPVMSQEPDLRAHGYLLHDVCFELLARYVDQELDIDRLFELCRSVPYSAECRGLTWDHCYGGLIKRDDQFSFPWEEKYRAADLSEVPQFPAQQYVQADPWSIDLVPLSKAVVNDPPKGPTEDALVSDCFAQLPFELREMIAVLLNTQEMLNLQSAVRSFLPMFESKRFWVSRYWSGNDRGFFFEVLGFKNKYCLRALWKATANQMKNSLFNRARIWSIVRTIVPLIDTRITPPTSNPPLGISSSIETQQCVGLLPTSPTASSRGCYTTTYRRMAWPKEVVRLAVSLADTGGDKYISGFQLTTKDGSSICTGYMFPEQLSCTIDSEVTGFLVAIGSRGLHAIRILLKSGWKSPWLGDPTDVPITHRLASIDPLLQLRIGFDAFKITRFQVVNARDSNNLLLDNKRIVDPRNKRGIVDLRRSATWYPGPPPPDLHLLPRHARLPLGFRPIYWGHFGGPEGKHLKYLTAVWVRRRQSINHIEFEYADGAPIALRHCLGRHEDTTTDEWERCSIDGRAGERIESISVSFGPPWDHDEDQEVDPDVLWALQIKTTLGRRFSFVPRDEEENESGEEDEPSWRPEIKFTKLPMVDHTVITGLFATQHPTLGFTDLGLMTEVCPESIKSERDTEPRGRN
ncbi:uncharacterized protein RHO25_005546 [Cercospora beticola]|uniref:DUF7600 domain-containing protein n=2 Tax=Cercospora beticola TaxID=122368 RepID=A0ABZ0NN63_CERBT|nr:hypothetical protein RHO25_005546 [Cercospora beticola]